MTDETVSRRAFFRTAAIGSFVQGQMKAQTRLAVARRPAEWSYDSAKTYKDPFNEIELDVVFTDPMGTQQRVPAFWAGNQSWCVRYSPHLPGRYTYHTVCSDGSNPDLHDRSGTLEVAPYQGTNLLYQRGPIRVAADRRHFEHADGTPFFWLGDTNWMGLCKRLHWPGEFQSLAADRVGKGFTVVQIVAGLYPDMPPFDTRGANEGGYPWEKDYTRINPAYFNMADLRIQHLAERGLVPCIVGCWGYFLPIMGIPKMKQHWRYLIARWGAYPVVWCLCGEVPMPFYLSKTREADTALQIQGWNELARYVRSLDPYRRLLTVHPCIDWLRPRDPDVIGFTLDPAVLDFIMLEISADHAVKWLRQSLVFSPKMPALVGEMEYEGMFETRMAEVQRSLAWACVLSGAAGHTYGANGVWQLNRAGEPFGPSPYGQSWGDTPWDVAAQYPGARQVGLIKSLLFRYPWWRLEPHPEWVELQGGRGKPSSAYAASIPGEIYIVYIPAASSAGAKARISHLAPGRKYRAFYFDPISGREHPIAVATSDAGGEWTAPMTPAIHDWTLVLDGREG